MSERTLSERLRSSGVATHEELIELQLLEAKLEKTEKLLEECRKAISSIPDRSIFGIGGDGLTHWYLADELLARIAADQRPAEELQ